MALPDIHEVAGELARRINTLATELAGSVPSFKSRTEWRFRNKGSLAVVISGADRGVFFDHEAGMGGDALDLICHLRTCTRKEAWRWAVEWLGRTPVTPPPSQRAAEPCRTQAVGLASTIWCEAVALAGGPGEAYLVARGLSLQRGAPLRFHPACPRGADRLPAMVAKLTDPVSGEPCGVHRTFLKPDGSGKADVSPAKMMLGNAGTIRLSPDDEVTIGLGICEGIETGLAILQRIGWAPVWACGSAGAIAKFPALPGIESITIFADADDKGAGVRAAYECAQRWRDAGREATVTKPPTGEDWLDAARRALYA